MCADEPAISGPQQRHSSRILVIVLVAVVALFTASRFVKSEKTIIGATAEVIETDTGLVFQARVDTGASVSSIHCEEFVIEGESPAPAENIGKTILLHLTNKQGETKSLKTRIVDYSPIRSADGTSHRYYVRLTMSCQGVERESLVTLNDRSRMSHRLLLGRDFLKGNFLVDLNKDNHDFR